MFSALSLGRRQNRKANSRSLSCFAFTCGNRNTDLPKLLCHSYCVLYIHDTNSSYLLVLQQLTCRKTSQCCCKFPNDKNTCPSDRCQRVSLLSELQTILSCFLTLQGCHILLATTPQWLLSHNCTEGRLFRKKWMTHLDLRRNSPCEVAPTLFDVLDRKVHCHDPATPHHTSVIGT